ncbi:MAG: hypothetical protein CMI53_03135 [Parcubacteria group bacterium]|nr:hypothetical protein [Parcubacteria group bacterium]
MKKTWLKRISLVFAAITIGFAIWLVNINFPSYDALIIESELGQDLPAISKLGPEPRVKLVEGYQTVLESPIYFDLRAMPWFKEAQVHLIYKEEGLSLAGVGGQAGPGFNYDVKTATINTDQEDGWQKAVFYFTLADVYSPKNINRFLISTEPTSLTDKEGELQIKQLKVILKK